VNGNHNYRSCDLCLLTLGQQMVQIQYSHGAFVYGDAHFRVTPESARLRDVQVCINCATHLRRVMDHLIEYRGRPARGPAEAAGG
jgi:hypothetical protein